MGLQDPPQADGGHIADADSNADSAPQLDGPTSTDADNDGEAPRESQQGYAKVYFPDGDYVFTTTTVVFGRNLERQRQIRRSQKQAQRARKALDTYRKEPSQPSQPGDGDQHGDPSESGQSLEGRPAPPSNFSEQGGPVWYALPSENEANLRRSKLRRRVSHLTKSSSTGSVAPASLHAGVNPYVPQFFETENAHTYAYVPIHTGIPEDINKISKDHLKFQYNFESECWELHVNGNRAIVNELLFEKGTTVALGHNDEIMIASLVMTFKLPDNGRAASRGASPSIGTFSEAAREEWTPEDSSGSERARVASTSPARRLSNAIQSGESESEEDNEDEDDVPEASTSKPKRAVLKLKAKAGGKKKPISPKLKRKSQAQKSPKRESSSEELPAPSNKKAQKQPEKKPKGAGKTIPGAGVDVAKAEDPPAGAAAEGDTLVNEPPRRSGPGRPPKDGNVSKRDKSLAQKLQKECEKRGERVPDFPEAVDIVRREQKEKAQRAKAIQNGELEEGQEIRPSIEVDTNGAGPSTLSNDVNQDGESSAATKRTSPKARRPTRAMSPVKPLAECTEEDLKKPEGTYLTFLDTILSEHSTGVADLQEIYELFMKKWPFFKYKIEGSGWQSSIRHNLLQNARFVSAGKSGKGKLWSINHDVPMEKEKRKEKPQQQKNQMGNGQYGARHPQHAQYGPGYGQPPPNGQPPMGPGGYYSPYPQAGYPPHQQAGQPSYGPSQQWQPQPGYEPRPPQLTGDPLVDDILVFNFRLAARYKDNGNEQQRHVAISNDIVNYLSECEQKKIPSEPAANRIKASETRELFADLVAIFRKHRPGIFIPDPFHLKPGEAQSWVEYGNEALQGQVPPSQAPPSQSPPGQQEQQSQANTAPLGEGPSTSTVSQSPRRQSGDAASAAGAPQPPLTAVTNGEETSQFPAGTILSAEAVANPAVSSSKRPIEDEHEQEPEAKRARAD